MNDYYNHVLLWIKANKPDYIIVQAVYKDHYAKWFLEPVNILDDGSIILDAFDFEDYVGEFNKGFKLKFYKFNPENFAKEEI